MPRPPRFAPAISAMPGAVYSPFAAQLSDPAHAARRIVPLHVGDTWLPPFEAIDGASLTSETESAPHRYGPTDGLPPLVDAIARRLRERNGLAVDRENVLVTAGATSGLSCVVSALVAPRDEVLILAPFWPLIRGIVQSQRGVPVEVPFYDRVHSVADAVAAVSERASERTVALYVSTPSNPTGRVLPREWLEALAELARREDWWLLSDEAYEELVYRGEHWSMGQAAPERTLTVHSFSKTFGMAGHRVGSVAGPAAAIDEAHKVSVHSAYHAPILGQQIALRALETSEQGPAAEWIGRARSAYAEAGTEAAKMLGLPAPEGSTFLFLNVEAALDGRGMDGFLKDCFERGVLVAPGRSAGSDYASWIRLCYTSAPPDEVLWAVARLAELLGER